ncbi:MAG: peptidylprolyl isomerase [Salinivirgaceae bacterium]|nr:peptidylprolyl isomerase [Salinivirgaceae bacterium]MBR6083918.1 peptidylprolyl isomerase [Salinivirgaceae bacterium]
MRTRINIGKVLISTVLAAVLCACGSQPSPKGQPQQQAETASAQTEKPKTKTASPKGTKKAAKPKKVRLTEDNVVEELTKYGHENPERRVKIVTSKGTMVVELYENTPLHRANFIHLIKEHYYDGTEFYRVINNFMIQGGDTDGYERRAVKEKIGKYTLPAEFREGNIHKRGALSMVREYENNPEKRSSPFEFFIVQGTTYTDGELNGTEFNYNVKIGPEARAVYKSVGGCAYLDGQHTVFGEVVEGLEVIDKIAAVKTDNGDWPIEAVTIKMEIVR